MWIDSSIPNELLSLEPLYNGSGGREKKVHTSYSIFQQAFRMSSPVLCI
jgi:lysozyme family protein